MLVYLLVCYLVDLVCLFGCRLLFGYLFYCVICLTVNNVVAVYWIWIHVFVVFYLIRLFDLLVVVVCLSSCCEWF